MSIEGQGHFFTIYFPGFVCFVLYLAKISGERLQDHWSSGFRYFEKEQFSHSADKLALIGPAVTQCIRLTPGTTFKMCFSHLL